MRVILDTNVFISAAINPHGRPATLLDAWRDNRYELLLSPPILDEIADVMKRPAIRARHGWTDAELAAFLKGLQMFAVHSPGELELSEIDEDPDDNKFLACAVEGAADYLVTGDSHLLTIGMYQGTRIVTPTQFLEVLSALDDTERT